MLTNPNFTALHDSDILADFNDDTNNRFNVLLHAVNRQHNFQHGFSRGVAREVPEAVTADEQNPENPKGGLSIGYVNRATADPDLPKFVVNLYCIRNNRDESGSLISLKQLRKSLKELNSLLMPHWTVGFTQFGTGIAGGEWDDIESVIFEELPNNDKVLYLPRGV